MIDNIEEDLSKTPTVELITRMTYLNQEIDYKLLKLEKIRVELVRRFPQVENSPEFQKKIVKTI